MDRRYQIYRKQGAVSHSAVEALPMQPAGAPPVAGEKMAGEARYAPNLVRAQRELERLLLVRYAPACVLIDEGLNILYFQGETGRYLEHARGAASLSLQKLARPALIMDISSAIQQARKEVAPACREHVHVEVSGEPLAVHIEVIPFRTPDAEAGLFLIVFEAAPTPASAPNFGRWLARWWAKILRAGTRSSETEKDLRIRQLQHEVEATRDHLQAAIEEHEAAREERKSAHKEALSANEEFQSTNEELETAKEELQSASEELSTTNEELGNRNRELLELNDKLAASRDHLNAIYDTLHEPILIIDANLRILEANPAFYEGFQTSRGETENCLLYELGNGQWNIPALRHLLEEILPKDRLLHDYEVSHAFPSLGNRTMLLNARRLNGDRAGAKDMILLAIEDVTERHNLLTALRETDAQKDRFLAMLSHELRNPLAPIENALQILRLKANDDSAQQRARAIIERQLGQLSRLLADLLEVSRVTTGTITLQHEHIELKDLIARAVETCRPLIDQREHQLTVSIPDQPVSLHGDPTRLEQVFINLLTNAAKYTDPGGQIKLTATRDGDKVIIRVQDNGIGIEDDLLSHVFEIFTQAQRGLARSHGGLGIGLSVAKALVELNGGTIDARSDGPGQGSEFIVRLPATSTGETLPWASVK